MTDTLTSAQKYRETWEDWLLPGQRAEALLTREELASKASLSGYKITPADLRYWESEGVIPRSVKKWHNGATRAVYPDWMRQIVFFVRSLQADNKPLEWIRDFLRSQYRKNIDDLAALNSLAWPRAVYQVNTGENQFLQLIAQERIKEFFELHGHKDIAYIDIKIVSKDGTPLMLQRYVANDLDDTDES